MDKIIIDDGLITPEVGAWAKEKYKHVFTYADIFASSMKQKWDCRVYIDLFAGSGRARIRKTGEIVNSSAMQALKVSSPFDRYVFCDIDPENISTLKARVGKEHPERNVVYHVGDVNNITKEIIDSIPQYSKDFKVLTFCFVDPFNLDGMRFSTLQALSATRIMDFLVLVATDMDANRNEVDYTTSDNESISRFLCKSDWRESWLYASQKGTQFGMFVLDEFTKQMMSIGYLKPRDGEDVLIRNIKRRAPLYRLSFYSKNKLGKQFWNETKKYSSLQMKMDF